MRILVVGSGAREHALAKALSMSESKPKVYAFMGQENPGIAKLCVGYGLGDVLNPPEALHIAKKHNVDLAVIGPEAPLAVGLADAFEEAGILCVGPKQEAAKIETDKSFARNLMREHKIDGTPSFGVFSDLKEACGFIDEFGKDVAVKPAGLTGGKGVKIMGEHFDAEGAKEYVKQILESKMGKIPKVILEERLVGEEFTLQGFVDGSKVVGSPMVQDHKRAYEGDEGPNTGGMGSYSDNGYILPFLTQKDYDDGLKIMQDTVKAIRKETGERYKGFLYGQFMATKEGVKVIEYNARLGDPEAMNTLSILESDMQEVCEKMAGTMLKDDIKFKNKATVCKYLVPGGYPEKPSKNAEVTVDVEEIERLGGVIYYASVRRQDGKILTSGSRAIAVVGVQNTITEAEQVAEKCMSKVKGDLRYRKDIGTRALIEKRIKHMKQLRKSND